MYLKKLIGVSIHRKANRNCDLLKQQTKQTAQQQSFARNTNARLRCLHDIFWIFIRKFHRFIWVQFDITCTISLSAYLCKVGALLTKCFSVGTEFIILSPNHVTWISHLSVSWFKSCQSPPPPSSLNWKTEKQLHKNLPVVTLFGIFGPQWKHTIFWTGFW